MIYLNVNKRYLERAKEAIYQGDYLQTSEKLCGVAAKMVERESGLPSEHVMQASWQVEEALGRLGGSLNA